MWRVFLTFRAPQWTQTMPPRRHDSPGNEIHQTRVNTHVKHKQVRSGSKSHGVPVVCREPMLCSYSINVWPSSASGNVCKVNVYPLLSTSLFDRSPQLPPVTHAPPTARSVSAALSQSRETNGCLTDLRFHAQLILFPPS